MREAFAVFLLRIGLGGVFIWFGADKFFHPTAWYGWVPIVIQNRLPISMNHFLYLQGVAEVSLGALIVAGLFTRVACFFCALILLGILYFTGFNEIMIRDLGLLAACLSLIVSGSKQISLDYILTTKR